MPGHDQAVQKERIPRNRLGCWRQWVHFTDEIFRVEVHVVGDHDFAAGAVDRNSCGESYRFVRIAGFVGSSLAGLDLEPGRNTPSMEVACVSGHLVSGVLDRCYQISRRKDFSFVECGSCHERTHGPQTSGFFFLSTFARNFSCSLCRLSKALLMLASFSSMFVIVVSAAYPKPGAAIPRRASAMRGAILAKASIVRPFVTPGRGQPYSISRPNHPV